MTFGLTELIREQGYQCLVSFGAGMFFMMVWQVCAWAAGQAGLKRWIRLVLEVVFWGAGAIMVSDFLYYGAYGQLSLHGMGAFAGGLLLWRRCFCGIITSNHRKGTGGTDRGHGKEKQKPPV